MIRFKIGPREKVKKLDRQTDRRIFVNFNIDPYLVADVDRLVGKNMQTSFKIWLIKNLHFFGVPNQTKTLKFAPLCGVENQENINYCHCITCSRGLVGIDTQTSFKIWTNVSKIYIFLFL